MVVARIDVMTVMMNRDLPVAAAAEVGFGWRVGRRVIGIKVGDVDGNSDGRNDVTDGAPVLGAGVDAPWACWEGL
jgi:hypothetical protein